MLPFLAGEQHGVVYSDLANFVEQLASLQADPKRCRDLGSAGAAAMRLDYDWVRIAEQFVSCMAEFN